LSAEPRLKPSPVERPIPPPLPVAIKGDRDGLRVTVRGGDPEKILQSLRDQLAPQGEFFQGAAVQIEFAQAPMDLDVARQLATILDGAGMILRGVTVRDDAKERLERQRRAQAPEKTDAVPTAPAGTALFVAGTLRGGQRIVHSGPVVVLGDVNPGAEIVAGESVIVWGQLRGMVEAGVAGDEGRAVVCALNLAPTQLRIGGVVARAPEENDRQPEPEVARLEEDHIIVNAWR
jgi:septum site-determining protein MinC